MLLPLLFSSHPSLSIPFHPILATAIAFSSTSASCPLVWNGQAILRGGKKKRLARQRVQTANLSKLLPAGNNAQFIPFSEQHDVQISFQ